MHMKRYWKRINEEKPIIVLMIAYFALLTVLLLMASPDTP
jgi:hypothetical protein